MANLPLAGSVAKISTPSFSVPTLDPPTLTVPRLNVPGVGPIYKPKTNTRRHVVDLGDIILGHPITGTRQLRNTLEDAGLEEFVYVPIVNRVLGFGLGVNERFLHPLAQGNMGTVLINTLETFGNTLDIVANPIKSLMPWAGGGTSADFLKSMGWMEDEYREIYQWDTGNIVTDFLGEVVSDPLNWGSLGFKQVGKEIIDWSASGLRKLFIKNIDDVLLKQADEAAQVSLQKMRQLELDEEIIKKFDRRLSNLNKKQLDLRNRIEDLDRLRELGKITQEETDELNKLNKSYKTRQRYINKIHNDYDSKMASIDALKASKDRVSYGVQSNKTRIRSYESARNASRLLTKEIFDRLTDSSDEAIRKFLKDLALDKQVLKETLTNYPKHSKAQRRILNKIKQYNDIEYLNKHYDLAAAIKEVRNGRLYGVYHTLEKVRRTAEAADDLLMQAALWTTPATALGRITVQYALTPGYKHLMKRYVDGLKNADPKSLLNDKAGVVQKSVKNIALESRVNHAEYWNPFKRIMNYYHVNEENLIKAYASFIDQYAGKGYNKEQIKNMFIKKLITDYMPALRYILNDTRAPADIREFIEKITPENIDDLLEIVGLNAVAVVNVKEVADDIYIKAISLDIEHYFAQHGKPEIAIANKQFTEYTILEQLTYIDKVLLTLHGKHYGLNQLRKFIEHAHISNQKQLEVVTAILNYLGITVKNSQQVSNLYRAGKLDELKELLMRQKTSGKLVLDSTKLEKHATRVMRRTKPNIPNVLDMHDPTRVMSAAVDPKTGELLYKSAVKSNTLQSAIDAIKCRLPLQDFFKFDEGKSVFEIEVERSKNTTKQAQQELKNILINNSAHVFEDTEFDPELLTDLDSLTKYMGFDYELDTPTSKLFDEILKVNADTASTQDLAILRDNLIELRQRSMSWFESLKHHEYDILPTEQRPDKTLEALIKDLHRCLKILDTKQVTIKINDLMNTQEDVFRQVILAQNRYKIIDDYISSSGASEMFDELSNTRSPVRDAVITAISELENTTSHYQAQMFQDVLSKIDNHNAMARLLNTQITPYELDTKIAQYLQGMLFNIIYKNYDEYLNRYIREASQSPVGTTSLLQEYMTELNKEPIRKMFIDYLAEAGLPIVSIEDLYAEIQSSVNEAFRTYIADLQYTAQSTHSTLKIYQELDSEAVLNMVNLGLDNEAILTTLKSHSVEDIVVQDVGSVIAALSGTKLDQDLADYALTVMQENYKEELKGVKGWENDIPDLVERINETEKVLINDSLSKALRNSYRAISERVSQLGGEQVILGRNYIGSRYAGSDYKTIKAYTNLYLTSQVDNQLRRISKFTNTYAWSTADGVIGFKKELDVNFIRAHNLNPKQIAYNREGIAFKFYKMYQDAYQEVSKQVATPKSLEQKRRALIAVYKDPTLDLRPKDPENYFSRSYKQRVDPNTGELIFNKDGTPDMEATGISDTDILIWDNITRRSSFNKNIANKYHAIIDNDVQHQVRSLNERVDYHSNPNNVIESLHETKNKNLISNPKDYMRIHADDLMDADLVDTIYYDIQRDFRTPIKDIETLKTHEQFYNNRIKQNVDSLDTLRDLDKLKQDTRRVGQVVKDENQLKILASYGIKPSTKMNSRVVFEYLMLERVQSLIDNIMRWNPKQLRTFIDRNTDGMLIYVDDKGDFFRKVFTKMVNQSDDWDEAGLKLYDLNKGDKKIYVITRTDTNMTNNAYRYVVRTSIFPEQQDIITQVLKKNRHNIHWEGMDVPDELFTGELMDNNVYEALKRDPKFKNIFGDAAEQKLYSKLDKNGLNSFHTRNNSRPNFTIIGSPSAFNQVYDYFLTTSTEDIFYIPHTTSLVDSVWNGCLESIHRENSVNKYLQLFFNDDYFIGNKVFKPILQKATDSELQDLFGRLGYKAVVLKETSAGKVRAYKIDIRNQKDLQNAIKNKAILIPHEAYRNLLLTVNKDTVESKLINLYKSTIVGTFKTIYLTSVGFLMRNYADSAIYKNNASYRGIAGMKDMFQYEYKAMKLLEWHDSIQRQVFALSNEQTFNRRNLRKILAGLTEEERKTYLIVDMFLNSSASGGLSKSFDEFLLKRNKENSEYIGYQWAKWYNEKVLDSPILNKLRDANNMVEQSSRFGLFLAMIEESGDYSKAIKEVINTHFDYALKEPGLEFLEQLFWFSTFPINNLMYYINYGLVRNPDMLKAQMDLIELSYNDGDLYTWDDVKKSNYLMYNATTGNVRLYFAGNDKDDPTARVVLKVGSSVLDFFSIICDPIGAAKERLNPFLSVLFGYDDPSQLNPLTTPINRVEQAIRQKNPLPSVFTTLYPKREYDKAERFRNFRYNYSKWNYSKRYYPKVRTYYQKQYYPQYHKRVYMNLTTVGYKWMKATKGKKIYFYDNGSKVIRAAGKMRRAMKKAKMPMYTTQIKETRY